MVTQINPFQQQVWRSLSQLQIGLGEDSVLLENLSGTEERFIASLTAGIAENQLEPLARQLKLDAASAKNLVSKLQPVLLKSIMAQPEPSDLADAELVRATLNTADDGFAVLKHREKSVIYLNRLNRSSVAIARALAGAHLGAIASQDNSAVQENDGYFKSLIGCSKVESLEFLLSQYGHHTKVFKRSFEKASVSVLIAQQCLWPRSYASLMSREQPHLAVLFDQAGVTVSPLVVPAETGCLYCLESSKIQQDAGWPTIASQLVSSQLNFDDSAANNFAAAAVTKIITDWIDLRHVGTGKRWIAATGEVQNFEILPSEDCGCQLQLRLEQSQESRALAS